MAFSNFSASERPSSYRTEKSMPLSTATELTTGLPFDTFAFFTDFVDSLLEASLPEDFLLPNEAADTGKEKLTNSKIAQRLYDSMFFFIFKFITPIAHQNESVLQNAHCLERQQWQPMAHHVEFPF